LNEFRTIRSVSARTWTKELGTIRHFFRHCLDNEWILRSWADKVWCLRTSSRPSATRIR
jgi:hypothetical protein